MEASVAPGGTQEQEKQRHAYGDAVAHLLLDGGLGAVGGGRADFNALIHGAGMHHEGTRPRPGETFLVDLP